MRFEPLPIAGALRAISDPVRDERGSFVRLQCEQELAAQGVNGHMVQTSLSISALRGTVRGLHFQWPPSAEDKLVRCLRGGILDVCVDLRPDSATFLQHVAAELSADNGMALYVPAGCAHGFQTLTDDAHVLYQMTDFYQPELAAGVRWNDPAFGIAWPLPVTVQHPRDAGYAAFDARAHADAWQARRNSRS